MVTDGWPNSKDSRWSFLAMFSLCTLCTDRNQQRYRAVSLRQHDYLVEANARTAKISTQTSSCQKLTLQFYEKTLPETTTLNP